MTDQVTLAAGGRLYSGWTKVKVTRHLEHMASDFDIEVSERWAGRNQSWQIPPMTPVAVKIGADLVLTGYTDDYDAELEPAAHKVRITGRSKTMDLVDCMPPIAGGQFLGSSLQSIANAVAQYFNIGVTFAADASQLFPEASYELTETAFAYLDRLCRLSGVLALDDQNGNLVLTQAGDARAAGALVEGQNGSRFKAVLSAKKRFSDYAVLAQAGLAFNGENALPQVIGEAKDPSVPRFRRFAEMAESAADLGIAQDRAQWRAQRNAGRGTKVTVTVPGWRQTKDANAPLWLINQLVPAKAPRLWLDRTLLVIGVTYLLDEQGARTEIECSPQEAYMPDPGSVKVNARLTGAFWNSVQPIN